MEPPRQAPLQVSLAELQGFTDEQLARHIGYFNANAPDHILGQLVLAKRVARASEYRGWAALVISIAALCISAYGAFCKAI